MAISDNTVTFADGTWHAGDPPLIRAADHAAWLGSSVFDGARMFDGLVPDLDKHCARTNASARAMGMRPSVDPHEMAEIARDGLRQFAKGTAVYIRPMYWATAGDATLIHPAPDSTRFALSLEQVAMPAPEAAATLTRTRFRRPVLETAVVNAKAGCLYPNNARMLHDARGRGFTNAIACDAMGNVAETATSNIFMVRDGVVFTPIPNGTFLAGITRARHIENMRRDGIEIRECVLTYADFDQADEVFMTGNMSKITPVTAFDEVTYAHGPVTKRLREMYWDWALSTPL